MSDQLRATLLAHKESLRKRFGGKLPECKVKDATVHLALKNQTGHDPPAKLVAGALIDREDVAEAEKGLGRTMALQIHPEAGGTKKLVGSALATAQDALSV